MKRLAFAIGVLALGFAAATPARADFAVAKFHDDYCRVWENPGPEAWRKPRNGEFLLWLHHRHHHEWVSPIIHRREHAERRLHWAVDHHRCHHVW